MGDTEGGGGTEGVRCSRQLVTMLGLVAANGGGARHVSGSPTVEGR